MFRACTALLIACLATVAGSLYKPTWPSLDSRPLPPWYDEAKFGIFSHWGLYSVPGIHSEWFWDAWKAKHDPTVVKFMKKNYHEGFTYADFAPQFRAELFDANAFAKIIRNSGANKHHEGYTMYPSNYSWNWNSWDVGPRRDLVGELRDALTRVGGVNFGLYYSLFEWFNPLFLRDKDTNFTSEEYVQMVSSPQLKEIVNSYKPQVIWSDGDWGAPEEYWKSKDFLAWLFNSSPVKDTVVVNDRWGKGVMGHHGSFFTYSDRYDPGHLLPHKWENCMTVDVNSWGYRRTMKFIDVLPIRTLITKLARTISCGGNLLLNVGPNSDGRIVPIFEERLLQMGWWLRVNGEGIYKTKPWIYQNDTTNANVWYTSKLRRSNGSRAQATLFNTQDENSTVVYAIVLSWPHEGLLQLGAPRASARTKATLLGIDTHLPVSHSAHGVTVDLRPIYWTELPTMWAWIVKLEYLLSDSRDPLKEQR